MDTGFEPLCLAALVARGAVGHFSRLGAHLLLEGFSRFDPKVPHLSSYDPRVPRCRPTRTPLTRGLKGVHMVFGRDLITGSPPAPVSCGISERHLLRAAPERCTYTLALS